MSKMWFLNLVLETVDAIQSPFCPPGFTVISKDTTNSHTLIFQIGKLSQGPCGLLRAVLGAMIPLPLVLLLLYYTQKVSTKT